ncbi:MULTISPECIES: transposase [unclassified Bacillus cereus group]|uniref:transposase n=1 Tax=unclassified Bacillus cereus group TaxID=2750818 RepID=UPI001F56D8E8
MLIEKDLDSCLILSPPSNSVYMDVTLLLGGDFSWPKKGTTFNTYSKEIKLSAVQSYLNGEGSSDMIAEKYQIISSTQLKSWVKKYKECDEITDTREKNSEKWYIEPFKRKTDSF